jgi:hypothetical protein
MFDQYCIMSKLLYSPSPFHFPLVSFTVAPFGFLGILYVIQFIFLCTLLIARYGYWGCRCISIAARDVFQWYFDTSKDLNPNSLQLMQVPTHIALVASPLSSFLGYQTYFNWGSIGISFIFPTAEQQYATAIHEFNQLITSPELRHISIVAFEGFGGFFICLGQLVDFI